MHATCRLLSLTFLKLLGCYVGAGAIQLLVGKFPNYSGHPDAPFTSFPSFLIWSPFAPVLAILDGAEELNSLLVFLVSLIVLGGIAFQGLLFRSRKQ